MTQTFPLNFLGLCAKVLVRFLITWSESTKIVSLLATNISVARFFTDLNFVLIPDII